MTAEYSKLADAVEKYEHAMRAIDTVAMDKLHREQEQLRMRIGQLDARRKSVIGAIARHYRLDHQPNLSEIVQLDAAHSGEIRRLQNELREVTARLYRRTTISQRLAGALLGHLNSAVQLFAAATQQSSTYTRQGGPRISNRLGAIEAVG